MTVPRDRQADTPQTKENATDPRRAGPAWRGGKADHGRRRKRRRTGQAVDRDARDEYRRRRGVGDISKGGRSADR
ncbi:hypothetical protein NDU88_005912 [Pleurodeles waltl]|uniref:Uncharacterized protein n=1 Tax=Pleurodeles waltl TaxID=8319 RepID=A0AAV7QG73_PLEWA|nr:hypothetical protein NDU88_005912 [Pleurodeles waltl]